MGMLTGEIIRMNAILQPDGPSTDAAAPPPPRPLVAPAIAMSVGILLGHEWGGEAWIPLAAAGAAVIVMAVAMLRRGPRPHVYLAAAMVFWICLGAGWLRVRTQVGPRDVSRMALPEGRLATVEGVLLESPRPSRRPDNPLLLQDDDTSAHTGMLIRATAVTVQGRRMSVNGRLRVTVAQPLSAAGADPPRTGDRLTVIGLLRPWDAPLNPGQEDIRQVYGSRGIHGRLGTKFWEAVTWRRPHAWDPCGWIGALRARIRRAMPDDAGAAARVIPALLLGDRTGLTDADEQAFIHAGVLHYLAVSGLHVALLSGLLLRLLRLLMVGPRGRAVILMAFIVLYALATELRPSVVRAGVFFILLCGATLLGRRRDLLNTLAAAALVVLLLNPSDLLQSGFQLSFLVALALIVVYPRVHERLFPVADWERLKERTPLGRFGWRLKRHLMQIVSVGLTAWAVSTPVAASHFHLVAPVGVLGTIVVLPIVFVLLLLGAVAAAVVVVTGEPVGFPNTAMETVSRLLESTIGWLAEVPYGHFYIREFGWLWAVMALGLVLVWTVRRRLRVARWQVASAAVVLAAAYVALGIPRGPADQVRITTLAVGSGNTVLVQGPNEYALLVDCGSSLLAERTGETVIVPTLWTLGVGRLDGVVLTHADADHIKDLPAVLQRIPCRRVFLGYGFETEEKGYDDRALEYLASAGLEVVRVTGGDALPAPDGVSITVLGPPADLPASADTNASSVVLKVGFLGRSMILTGDAPPDRLAAMARQQDVRCDVLLLPHHGERSEEIIRFLESSGATSAVMSVGRYRESSRRGEFAWPDGVRLYKTYRDGAVSVWLGRESVRVKPFVQACDTP